MSLTLLIGIALAVPVASQWAAERSKKQRVADTRSLIYAVLTNDASKAIKMLDRGADPNAAVPQSVLTMPDIRHGPLLNYSIRNSESEIASALIAHGANANARNSTQSTPLSLAVDSNQQAIVAALLAHGADVNAREYGETALFRCVGGPDNPKMLQFLIEHGADVNLQETGFGQTVLMREASGPSGETSEIVQVLLQAHANLEIRDMGGNTALRIAEKYGIDGIVKQLRNAGAKEYSLFPRLAFQKEKYKITDLGPGQANAINNRGEVVGEVTEGKTDGNGQLLGRAFFWSRGHMQVLTAFNGPSSEAESVNDNGQVVGQADFMRQAGVPISYTGHAFLWQDGVMQDLHPRNDGAPKDPAFSSNAVSITQGGQVAEYLNGQFFLWKNGEWKDLTSGFSDWDQAAPSAMNNSGQVVLYLQSSGTERAGLWENGKMRELSPPEIEPIVVEGKKYNHTRNYSASGINDKGQIVGQTDCDEPVLWSHERVSLLSRLYHYGKFQFQMRVEHINNRGQIVGTVSDNIEVLHPEQHAVLWQGGKVVDLNALIPAGSSWILEDANSINEAGQIVGYGRFGGKEHAFLLTPLTTDR